MEEKIKINFFKKIWYSIAKPSKYKELRKLGLGKSLKYFFSIISILAIILATIATFIQIRVVNDAISYLNESIPDFKFKDNKLTLDNSEASILDDERIISYLGNKIVFNPLLNKNEAINEYKDLSTENNNVLVFLNEEYVLISNKYDSEKNSEEGIENKKYTEISKNYIKDTNHEYTKKDVIEYLNKRNKYTYYIAQYFIIYVAMISIIYGIYVTLISIFVWLITKLISKIKKNSDFKWTFKDNLINTLYASTLSLIIYVAYLIFSYFTHIKIVSIDIISLLLIFVYIYILLWKLTFNKENYTLDKNKDKKTEAEN